MQSLKKSMRGHRCKYPFTVNEMHFKMVIFSFPGGMSIAPLLMVFIISFFTEISFCKSLLIIMYVTLTIEAEF